MANTTATAWVFGLVTLFGLGILFIVFSQVFGAHLVPVISQMVDNSTTIDASTKSDINSGISKYMTFFNNVPFILFIIVCVFMLVAAIRKEGDSF